MLVVIAPRVCRALSPFSGKETTHGKSHQAHVTSCVASVVDGTRSHGPASRIQRRTWQAATRLATHWFINLFIPAAVTERARSLKQKLTFFTVAAAYCRHVMTRWRKRKRRRVSRWNYWCATRIESSRPIRRWCDGTWAHGSKMILLHVWWAGGPTGRSGCWSQTQQDGYLYVCWFA